METGIKNMEMEPEENKYGICHCRIESADNGWIVEYTEKKPRLGGGMYDDVQHVESKQVFPSEKTDEAFDYFKKMKMLEKKKS